MDYIFREIDHYIGKYGDKITSLSIQDELFGVDKDRLFEFCSRIKKYKLSFSFQTRVDRLDEESIIALKNAGSPGAFVGIESANNNVLKSMNKSYTIEQVEKTLKLADKHGFGLGGNLIIGDIEDDLETVKKSETFYRKYGTRLSIFPVMVYPGTHLFKYGMENGIIKDELEYLKNANPFINVSKLPDNVYEALLDKYKAPNELFVKRPPIWGGELELSIDKSGRMVCAYSCPTCFSKIIATADNKRDTGNQYTVCPCCKHGSLPRFAKHVAADGWDIFLSRNLSEVLFRHYRGNRIVVWGMTDPIRRMIHSSQSLRDMLVKIVDMNYLKMTKESYCGLHIEAPEMLRNLDFDYILSGSSRRAEIEKSLEDMNIEDPKFIRNSLVLFLTTEQMWHVAST